MKYSEAKYGRVFIIRLEDGDVLHKCIEEFARKEGVNSAGVLLLGGIDKGSRLIAGPVDGRPEDGQLKSIFYDIQGVSEAAGVGTIFPDEEGNPILHMHVACGRNDKTQTGCVRMGVNTWHVGEVVIFEITDTKASRIVDKATGLKLLDPTPS